MSLSRPVLIKVRTLSICFIIVGLTSAGSDRSTTEMENGERMETQRITPLRRRNRTVGDRLPSSLLWSSRSSNDPLGRDAEGALPRETGSFDERSSVCLDSRIVRLHMSRVIYFVLFFFYWNVIIKFLTCHLRVVPSCWCRCVLNIISINCFNRNTSSRWTFSCRWTFVVIVGYVLIPSVPSIRISCDIFIKVVCVS